MEALLSSDDSTAPIIQTIALHAATILADDPSARYGIAKEIKRAYGTRSALIHRGQRGVSHSTAAEAQRLVEELYYSVLKKVSLTMDARTFQESLAKAGFGAKWPA